MTYQENKEWITHFLDLLEAHFGESVEFVVHDLTLDYEHTIVDIRNGQITGRNVGDTGDILGLQVLRGTYSNGEENYYQNTNFTKDGRTVCSSTVFLKDENGEPKVCIGINEDVTKYAEFEQVLRNKMRIPAADAEGMSMGRGNVTEILDYLMDAAQMSIGKNTILMTKDDKIEYIRYLDQRGAFLITKSGPRVCDALGISKYTLYNYLEIARSGTQ